MKYLFNIKPLTVNKAYASHCRRYKSSEYKKYKKALNKLFDPKFKLPSEKIYIKILFGFSSSLSDVDNPVKPLIDTLQEYYNFNDKNVFKLDLEKTIVKKGDEFIDLQILPYEDRTDYNPM